MKKIVYSKINSTRRKEFQTITRIIKTDNASFVVEKTGLNNGHIKDMYSNIMEYSKLYRENIVLPKLEGNTLSTPLVEGELLINAYNKKEDDKVISILHSLLDKEENVIPFKMSDGFASLFPNVTVPQNVPSYKISNIDMILENIILTKTGVTIIDLEWIFLFPIPRDFVLYRILKDCMRIDHREDFKKKFIDSFDMKMDESILEEMDSKFLNHVNEEPLIEKVKRDESYITSALSDDQKEIDRLNKRIKELGTWGRGLDATITKTNKRIVELQNEVETKNKHIELTASEARRSVVTLSSEIRNQEEDIKTKDETIASLNARIDELGDWGNELNDQIKTLDNRILELQEEVEEKNKHIELTANEAKKNEELLSSLINKKDFEIKQRDKSIESLNTRVNELGDWGHKLDEQVKSLGNRIEELQDEVEVKNEHIEKISLDSKKNEENLLKEIKNKDEEIKTRDNSIVSLNTRVEELGNWGHELDNQLKALNDRITDLQNEVATKNEHIEKISLEAKEKEENLSKEIERKEGEIKTRDASIIALNSRIEELGNWGKSLNEKISNLDSRIVELQDEVEEKNNHIKQLIEEAKAKEDELTSILKSKDSEISNLSLDVEARKEEIVSLNREIASKLEENKILNESLEKLKKEVESGLEQINSLNVVITSLKNELSSRDEQIETLNANVVLLTSKVEERDLIIKSYSEKITSLEQSLASVESKLKESEEEASRLNNVIKEKDNEIESLNNKINQQFERILILQNEEEERNIHIKKLDGEIDVLRERSNKLHEIENSTFYKVSRAYYKVRDFFIPMGSKRKMFLKLMGKMIRHPIWTIKHLTPENVRKFKKYSKSEGLARALERTDVYQSNNADIEYAKTLDLISMKPHDEYPILEFPKFRKVKVSIVIPVYNQFSYTYGCLAMILKNAGNVPYEVIIGDDCSTDETKDILACVKNIKVARPKENCRFLLNCNNAAKKASGEYIYFLNNDTNVQPGFLTSLVETIESDPTIGMVGSKLVYPNGMLQEAGGILWKDGSAWNYGYKGDANASEYNYRKEADYISGAAIMIKKSLWEEIGGFDTRFVPAYCEDSDLAFEVRKHGYKVVYDPFSVVVHYEGISNGTDINSGLKKYQVDNTKKFYEKWKDVLEEHYPNAENVFVARERSYKKKTLLVIDHYVPTYDKDAGSRTVFGYLKLFVKMGYNVKFMGENFYQSQPYTTTLQKMGVEVLYGPYYYHNWKTWIKEVGKNIDLVMFNRPHITKVFIDDVKANCPNAKFMYYGHDLHYMRLNREYEITGNEEAKKESVIWKEREWDLFEKVDLVLYPSKVEIDEIAKAGKNINAKVLQPYLFEDIQDAKYKFEIRKDIMFVGGFRHGPNVDGIMWFIKEVFPKILEKHPDIKLTVAGAFPPQELIDYESEHIKVTGFISDEELSKLYKTTRLIVVPLRYGAGIKGKVIEAMYNGVPVVTTKCGAEGIETDALVVDETLLSINDLYENKERLLELSKKEYEFMVNSYSMDKAKESFQSMVDELNK